jgi:prepilin-type N-terminal cleavage/methylation domain-containing protein
MIVRPNRRGFTLVEMLVATALIIFIMVILTQAFTAGMDAFLKLKTIGDMEERLRTAATILRQDLAADHFEGKKRLSDANFWVNGPPREGFLRIWQGSPSALMTEGLDGDGIPSFRATNHYLHFTVKRRGNRREEFALARVPAGSPLLLLGQPDSRFQDPTNGPYASQWYEVVYFLKDSGEVTPADPATGVPTKRYNLYRRQLLMVPDNYYVNWVPDPNNPLIKPVPSAQFKEYAEVSCKPGPQSLYFNNPTDLTVPQRRFGMNPAAAANGGIPLEADNSYPIITTQVATLVGPGADLLLTDVISFQVQVLVAGQGAFQDIPVSPNNTLFQNPVGTHVFDTWSNVQDDSYDYTKWNQLPPLNPDPHTIIPWQPRIVALKITLRIWDPKSQQSRQVTLVQDM